MPRSIPSILFMLMLALSMDAWAQSNSYQVIDVAAGGTIRGTVKWSGAVPPMATWPVTKDPEICDPQSHKHMVLERLIIGPQGGVANTVVYLKTISAGKPLLGAESKPMLDQKHCRYDPHILLVPQNSDIAIKSSDPTLHTVHMEGAATYNLPFPFQNQVSTRPMPTAGLVTLKCNGGHVWMNAEVFVIPHPYYAVTDESGKFELKDVPPGQYELVAWHEGWGIIRQDGTIDVLSQRRVMRPIFSDPRTWEKDVSVRPSGETTVDFVISEK